MKKILWVGVVSLYLSTSAIAQTVHPAVEAAVKAAPTSECAPANIVKFPQEDRCIVKVRLQNGTVVALSVHVKSSDLAVDWMWVSGPRLGELR